MPVEIGDGDIFIYDETPDDIPDLNIHGMSGAGEFVSTEVYSCDDTVCGGSTFIFSGSLYNNSNATRANLTGTLVPKLDAQGIPTGANVPGLIFFQDPQRLAQPEIPALDAHHKITGGSEYYINGQVHLGLEDLWLRGDLAADETYGGGCLTIIAGTFDLNGSVDLNLDTAGCGIIEKLGLASYVVRLVD